MRKESVALFSVVLSLALFGLCMVYSASAAHPYADSSFVQQSAFLVVGLIVLFIAAHFDYHRLRDPMIFRLIIFISLVMLVAVLIPGIGDVRNGARRWINITTTFSFQPSEMAKFALILLLAVKMSGNQKDMGTFKRGYIPCCLTTGVFCGLVLLENDLGTPMVMGVSAFFILFIGGVRWYYLFPSLIPAAGAVWLLIVTNDYRFNKMTSFLDPWSHIDKYGYQLIQSMSAFAKGSVAGVGPGAGEQKLRYLPEADTDFIFAVVGEEFGLLGTLAVIALFVSFLVLALRIAMNSDDLFGTLMASGIASLVVFQAGFNMAVTIGLLPTKGLPLPLISRGGTSFIMTMGMIGILLNIGLWAKPVERKQTVEQPA
jgi:cell division protein FtsW